jgi:hypothetical protein
MTWLGLLPASSRRIIFAVAVAALFCAGPSLQALTFDGQDQAAAPAPDPLKFDYDGPLMVIYTVKAERTADFEALWNGIREGLAKNPDMELQAFAETLRPYRVEGSNLYVFLLNPPSKKYTYNPVELLYKNIDYNDPTKGWFTREKADELWLKKGEGSYEGGIQIWKLKKIGM